jgi:hypothetical protein
LRTKQALYDVVASLAFIELHPLMTTLPIDILGSSPHFFTNREASQLCTGMAEHRDAFRFFLEQAEWMVFDVALLGWAGVMKW